MIFWRVAQRLVHHVCLCPRHRPENVPVFTIHLVRTLLLLHQGPTPLLIGGCSLFCVLFLPSFLAGLWKRDAPTPWILGLVLVFEPDSTTDQLCDIESMPFSPWTSISSSFQVVALKRLMEMLYAIAILWNLVYSSRILSWAAFLKQNGLETVAKWLCSLTAEANLWGASFQLGQPQKNGRPFLR